ncbi:MAG: hypothetical protein ACLUZZ_03720 [Alistipes inops]
MDTCISFQRDEEAHDGVREHAGAWEVFLFGDFNVGSAPAAGQGSRRWEYFPYDGDWGRGPETRLLYKILVHGENAGHERNSQPMRCVVQTTR